MEGGSFIFTQYEKYSLYVFHETSRNKCNPDNLKGERYVIQKADDNIC